MKRLLRSKANYEVLEGFLSELLKDDLTIVEILESESNQETHMDELNHLDLKVKNSAQEIIIIEIQYDREMDYFQRIYDASSKAITEHMHKGKTYQNIIKVIYINILSFNLGEGDDYIYRGTTRFKGLHEQDELRLSSGQKKLFGKAQPHDIFPEYYLIRVNKFNDIARDSLDVMKLSEQERAAYENYLENKSYQASMYQSTYVSGHLEGRQEGRKEEKVDLARLMKKEGESVVSGENYQIHTAFQRSD